MEIVEDQAPDARSQTLGDDYPLHFSSGHTPGLMLVEIPGEHGPLVFAGDLVPGVPWVHAPITMGYDRYPELLIEEKRRILEQIRDENGWMFFTHDANTAIARVSTDERGRFSATDCEPTLSWA